MTDLSTLSEIYESVLATWRATRTVIPGRLLEGYIDTECAVPWMSFAMPLAMPRSAGECAAAVEGLRLEFKTHKRILRFELFDTLWPGLPGMLEKAGMNVEEREPLLVCRPEDLNVAGDGTIEIEQIDDRTSLETLVDFVNAQRRAYGHTGGAVDTGDEALSMLKDIERSRFSAVAAVLDGEIIGTAAAVGTGPIRELAGVCTVPEHRKKGVAYALSQAMVSSLFSSGGRLAWLTAGSPEAERIYRRLGFVPVDAYQINLSDQPPS